AYGVPLVGGHTNFAAPALGLAASVLGRAERLITSFDAQPGDLLIAAIDYRGRYHNFDNYCAAFDAPADRLRRNLEILPQLAESGLVRAGKDISQGGIVGTALMLAECSGVGITLDLARITPPRGVAQERWLRSFPSFGFLLAVTPENAHALCTRFSAQGITAARIGRITPGTAVLLEEEGESALFWDHARSPYLDLGVCYA
ncbi:AIR synthase, partial [Thioclava sp. BHET1]